MADILMKIAYDGAVVHRFGDEVVVAYETEDDIVEHRYVREQFIDGELPEEDERVSVEIVLKRRELPPLTGEDDEMLDLRSHRKNTIQGPHTF